MRSGSKPLEVRIRTGVRLLGTPDRGTAFDDELVLNQNEKEKKKTHFICQVLMLRFKGYCVHTLFQSYGGKCQVNLSEQPRDSK